MKIGILTAGDMVTAVTLPNGEPTEQMNTHYLGYVAMNLDVETLTVSPDRWERIKAALEEQPDVKVYDFTGEVDA